MLWLIVVLLCCFHCGTSNILPGLEEVDSRNKRATRECAFKFQRVGGHTACLPPSPDVKDTGVSNADKALIVNRHNEYRAQVVPAATNMIKLVWDDEIAMIAQAWAETCGRTHDAHREIPGRFSCGQNLAWGYSNWEGAMAGWWNEKDIFNYNGVNSDFPAIGHYTQLVWATTAAIGCGYSRCGSTMYVCNYGPSGNIGGSISTPYKAGSYASDCPQHRNGNLCDCNGKVCETGATLNLQDCTCDCSKPTIHQGHLCKMNCTAAKVHPMTYCGKPQPYGFPVEFCGQYSNVPLECPWMCEICPLEDPNESTTITTLTTTARSVDGDGPNNTTIEDENDINKDGSTTPVPEGSACTAVIPGVLVWVTTLSTIILAT